MGKFDSSRTRVVPVFDHLLRMDPSGRRWLRPLLELGSRANQETLPEAVGDLLPHHPAWWGHNERPLSPALGLLEWLVQNISPDSLSANSKVSAKTQAKRRALAHGDPVTVSEALQRLRSGERGREWFVLEGASYPDAVLETEHVVIVVEGKRTERTTTSKTTWMSKRSQLIRHMDAALEIANGRHVLGLLIVEGDKAKPNSVPKRWLQASAEQLNPELLIPSLPHRSKGERLLIASGVLGATTWQRVCQNFSIPWPPAMDV